MSMPPPPPPPPNQGNSSSAVVAGAAVVGGVAATIVAGPLIGIAAAGGAAYAATRSDKIGEAAKATGNAAITVGKTAQQVDREHHITQKATQATKDALGAAAAFNERHDITGKVSDSVSWMANGITKALGGPKPPPPRTQ